MDNIKFRQGNKNNGHYYYWGNIDGGWVDPKKTDNYISPDKSDRFINMKDDNDVEIYEGDRVEVEFPYIWGDLFVRKGEVKYSDKMAKFYIDLEEDVEYFGRLDFEGIEIPINTIKIIE